MAQGNYIALQALKPTEIKVGELYDKWVDGYIKNGEAERAAQAKMLIEQKKSAQEINAKIDPKIVNTLLTFQPQLNKIWGTIMTDKQKVGQMIDSGKMDSEYYALKSKNENMFSQYLQLSSILTNPQFLEADKKINEQIQAGDVFEGDENMGRWMSIKSGMAQLRDDPNTGNIEVVYNDNIKNTDTSKPARVEQLHEFASNYSSGVSKNLKSEIEGKLKAVSAEASKKINSDGITTYDSKAFNEVTARNTITQLMGLDPNKPVEEQFTNVNNLTPFAKQYFYGNGRLRFPENGEDLKVLVDDAVNFAKGYSNTSYGKVTSQSAAEQLGTSLSNKLKIKELNKQDAPTSGGAAGFTPSEGEYVMQVKDAKGNVVGFKKEVTSVLPIAKNIFVGLSNSRDANGNYYNSYKIGEKAANGEIVFANPIQESQFKTYIMASKLNPITVMAQLKNNVTQVNKFNPDQYQKVDAITAKTNPYTSLKIGSGSNVQLDGSSIFGQ